MRIAFISNFLNHHQIHLSRELYRLTNGNFCFIETEPMPQKFVATGYPDYSNEAFVVKAWKNSQEYQNALKIVTDSDAVLFTPYAFNIVKARLKTEKLSFDVGERWFKQGLKNILSPTLIKMQWFYHTQMNKKNKYKLCSSAFGYRDQYYLHSYINKCYKWGYFTKVEDLDFQTLSVPRNGKHVTMMWCARFLSWKHPELPIQLAAKLKEKGYSFHIDMYGSGVEYDNSVALANQLRINDVLSFCGNVHNDEILSAMSKHDIFLFTSDRNEGWGAVANEAMSKGCVIVGSDEIGSIPFLVSDGQNGIVFKSQDIFSLTEKVEWLMNHSVERNQMAETAYKTIKEVWSPNHAAKSLVQLIDDLLDNRETSINTGPCSKAVFI